MVSAATVAVGIAVPGTIASIVVPWAISDRTITAIAVPWAVSGGTITAIAVPWAVCGGTIAGIAVPWAVSRRPIAVSVTAPGAAAVSNVGVAVSVIAPRIAASGRSVRVLTSPGIGIALVCSVVLRGRICSAIRVIMVCFDAVRPHCVIALAACVGLIHLIIILVIIHDSCLPSIGYR